MSIPRYLTHDDSIHVLKKYANRKIYSQNSNGYVSLPEILAMVQNGENIMVLDHKTKANITGTVLIQAMHNTDLTRDRHLHNADRLVSIIRQGHDSFSSLVCK